MLKYVGEPLPHFVCNDIRLAIRHLPAALHHKCNVLGNIHETHINLTLFGSLVSDEESPALLAEIR